jgi:predicted branched-subunit amino acid permease
LNFLRRHPLFVDGVRDMARLLPGFGAWGLVTGVAMVKGGLSVPLALLMSIVVFAGSAQLAALPLLAAHAPLWVILVAAGCVNLRFVIYSAQLRAHLSHLRRRHRVALGYVIGDMSYVLFVRRFATARAQAERVDYLHGLCALNWIGWQVASCLGIALADAIPESWGLGFAGVLALLGLLYTLINDRTTALAGLIAAAAAASLATLPLHLNIVAGIVAAVGAGLWMEGWQTRAAMEGPRP